MSQTQKHSIEEAVVNTAVGLLIAWAAQALICWAYNIPLTAKDNWIIVFWMTVLSLARNYCVRRFFNRTANG
jgi:hypothetical protein